jgi:gliding motility-associatede transport system auxiliary component
MNVKNMSLAGALLALVLFFAVNIAANASLRSVRMDLTEDEVFTLDEGSKSIAKGIDEPINLYFYFSRKLAREFPPVVEYADRVLGVLREYERASEGNIRLSVVDPEPFSEEEDQAVEQGLQGAPMPSGDSLYFGLVGTNATDARESIPFFALDEAKQRTLEYDLSKLIWTLAHPDKKSVGILTALPIEGGGGNPMMGQQGEPPWGILEQLRDFFDVEVLPASAPDLSKTDVLVVIHPRGFTEDVLYQIDQWALAGKPLVVFVDPQCDVDPGASDDPSNPMSRFTAKKDSDLEKLFTAWGIELAKNKVVCDRTLGVRQAVRSRDGRGQSELPVVFFLQLKDTELSREDPVTRLLSNVLTVTPGSLKKRAEGTTTFTPLLQTSEESQEVDSAQFQFMPEPQQLLASFVPGYERLTLAARVTGNVKTAYPDGKPGAAPETPPAEGETPPADPAAGLKESTQPLSLVVVSDADMLHDRMCLQEAFRIGNQRVMQPISENVDLLKNAIESVSGGQELMSIRMRGKTSRPFERVLEIQREADQRLLARQKQLEGQLQDAEARLTALQKAKTEGSEELVTAAQREEEEKVREEFVQTRRDLRDVKHQQRKDIERLGTNLKWLNLALVPALVCAAAVALGAWRAQQRLRK